LRDLILSDIHANWEALEAVLARAAGRYDRIVCCGDLIGYGPDPNRVLDWTKANVTLVVRGNHDKASAGLENLEWFNPSARVSALWTRDQLTPENAQYVRQLPKGPLSAGGYQIAHGSPLDEDEYLITSAEAGQAFAYADRDITFFGHTHVQGGFTLSRRLVRPLFGPGCGQEGWKSGESALDLNPDDVYLINPGSVGQPRDGDPRAAYALFNPADRYVTYCREPYDVPSVQAKIRRAGLPDSLADRLALGK
jgi:predicted phosphodiesterase